VSTTTLPDSVATSTDSATELNPTTSSSPEQAARPKSNKAQAKPAGKTAAGKPVKPAAQTPAKTAAKTAAKTPAKKVSKARTQAPTTNATVTATKPASTPKVKAVKAQKTAEKAVPKTSEKAIEKTKKPKLVRDSFTIPKAEYEVLEALKQRAAKLGQAPKKSELLRAGLKALEAMNDTSLLLSLAAVPAIKTGRPKA
jgi:hypothetical protein